MDGNIEKHADLWRRFHEKTIVKDIFLAYFKEEEAPGPSWYCQEKIMTKLRKDPFILRFLLEKGQVEVLCAMAKTQGVYPLPEFKVDRDGFFEALHHLRILQDYGLVFFDQKEDHQERSWAYTSMEMLDLLAPLCTEEMLLTMEKEDQISDFTSVLLGFYGGIPLSVLYQRVRHVAEDLDEDTFLKILEGKPFLRSCYNLMTIAGKTYALYMYYDEQMNLAHLPLYEKKYGYKYFTLEDVQKLHWAPESMEDYDTLLNYVKSHAIVQEGFLRDSFFEKEFLHEGYVQKYITQWQEAGDMEEVVMEFIDGLEGGSEGALKKEEELFRGLLNKRPTWHYLGQSYEETLEKGFGASSVISFKDLKDS